MSLHNLHIELEGGDVQIEVGKDGDLYIEQGRDIILVEKGDMEFLLDSIRDFIEALK